VVILYSSPTPEEMKAEGLHLWRAVGAQKSVMLFAAGDSGKPVGGPDGGSGNPKKNNKCSFAYNITTQKSGRRQR